MINVEHVHRVDPRSSVIERTALHLLLTDLAENKLISKFKKIIKYQRN